MSNAKDKIHVEEYGIGSGMGDTIIRLSIDIIIVIMVSYVGFLIMVAVIISSLGVENEIRIEKDVGSEEDDTDVGWFIVSMVVVVIPSSK